MSEPSKYMVNHLTRIIMRLVEEPLPYGSVATANPVVPADVRGFGDRLQTRAARVAAMMEALADHGFVCKFSKNCVLADSDAMEAQEAKKYLLARGFEDTEFQVMLEYARKWDVL